MNARVWIDSIKFSGGQILQFDKDDIVVIVGPNNAGKTATLRALENYVKTGDASSSVSSCSITKRGNQDELIQLLEDSGARYPEPHQTDPLYKVGYFSDHAENFVNIWNSTASLGNLSSLFCRFLTASERLSISEHIRSINLLNEPPTHPVHYLYLDESLEENLSCQFRQAFGDDLIVHRSAGSHIPLLIGQKPKINAGQDRLSYEYLKALSELPQLYYQGDGMRSFVGVLLCASVGHESILLIDEPEAFLHPPQARLLGRMLVSNKSVDRQLFIATHSGDVLRGILDEDSSNVRIIRIIRDGDTNKVSELVNNDITKLWQDPLLRYSNILDGLFHEKVVLAESDSDCRFYAAVSDALYEQSDDVARKPDVMFTHCGGKARLPLIIKSLRKLCVWIACIADFDVLNDEQPLRSIYEATGGDWSNISKDWRQVRDAIKKKKPELSTTDIKRDIYSLIDNIQESVFPVTVKQEIQSLLSKSSPWSIAKTVGKDYVPSGAETQACNRLLDMLESNNIFVVEVGELEGFDRRIANHGPSWVNEAIKMDLKNDPELDKARKFVKNILYGTR